MEETICQCFSQGISQSMLVVQNTRVVMMGVLTVPGRSMQLSIKGTAIAGEKTFRLPDL